MELLIYPKLSTRSRRAMLRKKKRWGHKYYYTPRSTLVLRLMEETGLTYLEVLQQISVEQKYLWNCMEIFKQESGAR